MREKLWGIFGHSYFEIKPQSRERSLDVMGISWFPSLWCLRWDRCSCIGHLFGEFLPRWMPHRLQPFHQILNLSLNVSWWWFCFWQCSTNKTGWRHPAFNGLCGLLGVDFVPSSWRIAELWCDDLWDILWGYTGTNESSILTDSPCFGQRSESKRLNPGMLSGSWATHLKTPSQHGIVGVCGSLRANTIKHIYASILNHIFAWKSRQQPQRLATPHSKGQEVRPGRFHCTTVGFHPTTQVETCVNRRNGAVTVDAVHFSTAEMETWTWSVDFPPLYLSRSAGNA